jgi:hypothetical protein
MGMEETMVRKTKVALLVFAVFAFLFGLPLLFFPGRFLGLFGWQPVDPLISRMFGAALLSMSWTALRGYLTWGPNRILAIINGYLVFTALSAIGLLRHLLTTSYYPFMVWFVFILLAAWAIAWGVIYHLLRKERSQT